MRAREFIVEYKREQTANKFGKKILARIGTDPWTSRNFNQVGGGAWFVTKEEATPAAKIDKLLEIFEAILTSYQKYIPWVLKQWVDEKLRIEDLNGRVIVALRKFEKIKPRIKRAGIDINILNYDWYTFQDMIEEQDAQSGKEIKREEQIKAKKESEILYDGELGKLIVPKTEHASCFWGRGTRWCTASTDSQNYFDHYNQKGPLYIWLGADGSKYQFHFESRQFMDERDISLDSSVMNQLRTKHPVISKLFKKYEDQLLKSKNVSDIYDYARSVIKGRWPEAEPYILRSPSAAYGYAKDVIKGRWPEAESYIMKDPESAYMYAVEVIKGRWPEAEPLIIKAPDVASMYAIDIIKGRWPEAESVISTDAESAYYYAKDVIKGRWPEAESVISTDAGAAYMYAIYVIKGRWPEAESVISTDANAAYIYVKYVIKGRWPEAEPYIKGSRYQADYEKRFGIKL